MVPFIINIMDNTNVTDKGAYDEFKKVIGEQIARFAGISLDQVIIYFIFSYVL